MNLSRAGKKYFLICLFLILSINFIGPCLYQARAQEETIPKLVEVFTLDKQNPRREFYDGKLKTEFLSSTENDYMKTIIVRISSDMIKAEYHDEWQEHTYLEQTKYYIGNPVSGSPFKCMEGWIYYKSSSPGSVTLALHEGPEPVDSFWYTFTVKFMQNWQYGIMVLGWIALAFVLYFYIPFLWGFVSIQIQARSHALATGFESYPVLFYILKKLPVIVCVYFLFYFILSSDWKGALAALFIAICLQLYFNWYNRNILVAYAGKKNMAEVEGTKKRAFQGHIKEMTVSLAVGGTYVRRSLMSYLLIEISLKNKKWHGLELIRNKKAKWGWDSSMDVSRCQGIEEALTALSRLPRYSINNINMTDDKLRTAKAFAPDSPAEINLLVDRVADLALSLDSEKRL